MEKQLKEVDLSKERAYLDNKKVVAYNRGYITVYFFDGQVITVNEDQEVEVLPLEVIPVEKGEFNEKDKND